MSDTRPIGMLDSGVGGLSVLHPLRTLAPHENVIYFGDEGHLPYGPRPRTELRAFVEEIAQFLLHENCKLIVIPCNAANAAALHYLRSRFAEQNIDVPIVGMEPAIKPAATNTRTGVIGVITTKATHQGELFASVIDRFAQNVKVETQVCPELVLLAEQGAPDTAEARQIIANYLAPLKAAGIDQLVLGCTHFPFLQKQIEAYLGSGVTIVDPSPAVARQVLRILEQKHIQNSSENGTVTYYTSGELDHFINALKALLGEVNQNVRQACWQDGRLTVQSIQGNS